MSFTGFPFLSTLLLFAAAAGTLAVLHRLRSHPRHVRVVTTLFWHDAKSAAMPRTLWHRFRYFATFLLLATIVGLLAFSVSRPIWRMSATPARHVAIVIDAGMSMQAQARPGQKTRFELAQEAAYRRIDALGPRHRLAIVAADPIPRVICRFEQPLAAARRELAALRPASQPADTAAAIRLARSLLVGREDPAVVWLTDEIPTTRPAAGRDLPGPPLTCVRVGEGTPNAGLLSAMLVPDPVEQTRGRLVVRVGWWGRSAATVTVRAKAEGSAVPLIDERLRIEPGRSMDASSVRIPADGRHVRVTLLEEEGIAADNEVTLRLPNRPEIVVAADAELPRSLRLALTAAPARAVPADASGATVRAVAGRFEQRSSGGPMVMVVKDGPSVPSNAAVRLTGDSPVVEGLELERAICGAGPAIIPPADRTRFSPLLAADEHILAALDTSDTAAPRLLLSAALCESPATVPNCPAFAILVSRAVRRLAGWDAPAIVLSPERSIVDPAWVSREAAFAEPVVVPGDRCGSDLAHAAGGRSELDAGVTATVFPAVAELMLAVALILLFIETVLHSRGRIV